MAKILTIIYLSSQAVFKLCPGEKSWYVPGVICTWHAYCQINTNKSNSSGDIAYTKLFLLNLWLKSS